MEDMRMSEIEDIPSNVIAFGNPLKIHREITAEDEY